METADDQIEDDPDELQREIERASRLASAVTDPTPISALACWRSCERPPRLAARRAKEAIRARARELWEIEGRPAGRDLDFWLQAEREFREAENH